MPNPGPATTITEHPIGGGGGPAYLGVSGAAVGFYQDPYGGGAVTQRTGPVQAVLAVSQATGYMLNYTSLSQGSPVLSAQNVSSTQITMSGAPQLSTADVVIANKQAFVSNFAVGQTVRVVSVSQQANTLVVALNALNANVSGVGTVTPNGETYVMAAFKGPLVNTVTLTPAVVAANSVAEQNFTVSGLQPGMIVALQKPTEQAALAVGSVRVPSANTLAVQFLNIGNTAITPTASEVYSYTALLGVQGVSPILVAGVNLGGSTNGIATLTSVTSGGGNTPLSVKVTGINTDDLVLGTGQNTIPLTAANQIFLGEARVSSVVNTMQLSFVNTNSALTITALSTDTWMIPIMRPNGDAPMTILPATVVSAQIGPNSVTEVAATVTGITVSGAILVQKPTFTSGLTVMGSRVTAASLGQIAIAIANPTTATLTLPAETYLVAQFRPGIGSGHHIAQLVAPMGVQGVALTNEMRNVLAGTGLMKGS